MSEEKTKGSKDVRVEGPGYASLWHFSYEHTDGWLDFKAWRSTGTRLDANESPLWGRGFADTRDGVNPDITGHVKFDGCMEIELHEGADHFCGRGDVVQFGHVLAELHALCKLLPYVDECAGYGKMEDWKP